MSAGLFSGCGHHRDLNPSTGIQGFRNDGGPHRIRWGKALAIHLIEGSKVPRMAQVDRGLENLVQARSFVGERGGQVMQNQAGLCFNPFGRPARALVGHFARDKEEAGMFADLAETGGWLR